MKPTEEQQNYLDASGLGKNIVLRARAGTGKTATAKLLGARHSDKSIRIAVFNSRNAIEMQKTLPSNMIGSTFHSMCGKWIFGKKTLQAGDRFSGHKAKVPSLVLDNIPEYDYRTVARDDEKNREMYDNVSALADCVSLLKNTFPEDYPSEKEVIDLCAFHQITFLDSNESFANNCIKILKISDGHRQSIDFDDMIRFPVIDKKIKPDCDIFVGDEIQDSTPIRIHLLKMMASLGVEVHAPGDDWQGIYVFTGASMRSVEDVTEALNADVMPLTINFRCSKAVIREAQKIVPDIKYFDESPEGLVKVIDPKEFGTIMQPGDCAIARFNKVIIPKVFALLREGKKATIQGADFGKQLVRLIKSVKANTVEEFNQRLAKMEERDLAKCTTDFGKQVIEDKYATIAYFVDNSNTIEKAITLVEELFSNKNSPYTFSTAHKSKGLEWTNTFILDNENFCAPQAKLPWQVECEKRLEYVAKTRARLNMYYV